MLFYTVFAVFVFAFGRQLLFSECIGESLSSIRLCNLSATECVLLLNGTLCIRDLVIDSDTNSVYWIEATIIMQATVIERRAKFVTSVYFYHYYYFTLGRYVPEGG